MLLYESSVPGDAGEDAPVAVLLHGRGSHRGDLQALRDRLPDDLVLLTPQAPHPGHPWGYGPGWAWYRYLAQDRVVPETLEQSLSALDLFLDGVWERTGLEPRPVWLGGFSQGGTTSLAYGLSRPDRVAGVLNFSGFLPARGIVDPDPDVAGGLPVFWGHGRKDPNIPHVLALRGRDRLREVGTPLEARDYEIGHWIDPGELADAVRWMGEHRPGRTGEATRG